MKFTALFTASIAAVTVAQDADFGWGVPNTAVIDGVDLAQAKRNLERGDRTLKEALKHLTAQADYWLDKGPWTVTNKTTAPPGGSIHDYASQAPYWWPNPNTTDGCPYIQRDGVRNPDVDKYAERTNVNRMFNSSYVLSLAWYYTGKPIYAQKASTILRTWFLDEKTYMAPNLNHAQIIPCANTGRSIGIIDFSQEFTNVVDAVAILNSGAPFWTGADRDGFTKWTNDFLTWLTQSKFGIDEANAKNNHGTFANMQIAALALFVGNKTLAKTTSNRIFDIINSQIAATGFMPQETARTNSWHYSNFNLGALLRWALVAKKVGLDVYKYKGPQGQSVFKAANVMIPAAINGASKWPFQDLTFEGFAGTDNMHAAAQAGLCQARRAVKHLPPPPGGDIFPLRPAPQQLDSIVVL